MLNGVFKETRNNPIQYCLIESLNSIVRNGGIHIVKQMHTVPNCDNLYPFYKQME
jgi:hypothetical protein